MVLLLITSYIRYLPQHNMKREEIHSISSCFLFSPVNFILEINVIYIGFKRLHYCKGDDLKRPGFCARNLPELDCEPLSVHPTATWLQIKTWKPSKCNLFYSQEQSKHTKESLRTESIVHIHLINKGLLSKIELCNSDKLQNIIRSLIDQVSNSHWSQLSSNIYFWSTGLLKIETTYNL